MLLGLVMVFVGLAWFVIRKPIARRQAVIIQGILRRRDPLRNEQLRGLEMAGLYFCC